MLNQRWFSSDASKIALADREVVVQAMLGRVIDRDVHACDLLLGA